MKYDELINRLKADEFPLSDIHLLMVQAADAIEELQKENASLIDKISKLRRKVKRMEIDAAWDKDIINGQVHGMW